MDKYLLDLLAKIEAAERGGTQYFYKFAESSDPHGEVDGLKELERAGYISCGHFLKDNQRPGGYYVSVGPCRLEYSGRKVLRDQQTLPHIQKLIDTSSNLPNVFNQTLEHLAQARKQLTSIDSERARKDAVRDCLSAMESLLKTITGASDIKDATVGLRDKQSSPDVIMKDGLSIWSHIHRLYKDVRHGQPTPSRMSKAEALYWIDRIIAFIGYVSSITETSPR